MSCLVLCAAHGARRTQQHQFLKYILEVHACRQFVSSRVWTQDQTKKPVGPGVSVRFLVLQHPGGDVGGCGLLGVSLFPLWKELFSRVISLFLLGPSVEVRYASTQLLWSITGHCWVTSPRWLFISWSLERGMVNKERWLDKMCVFLSFFFFF